MEGNNKVILQSTREFDFNKAVFRKVAEQNPDCELIVHGKKYITIFYDFNGVQKNYFVLF